MDLYKFLNSPSIVLLQYFNSFSVIDKIVDIDTILVLLNLNTMITNQLTNRPGSRDAIASNKKPRHDDGDDPGRTFLFCNKYW